MDSACYRCGHILEEGKPFCPQCNAPQIRVAGFEPPAAPPTPEFHEQTGDRPVLRQAQQPHSQQIDWLNSALPAAAWAGLVAALLMIVPLGAFGPGMLVGGALAVFLYRRKNPLQITAGTGAKLGAASGAIGYGILMVLLALSLAFFHTGNQLRQALLQAIQQAAARSSDPQAQPALEFMKSPQGITTLLVLAFILMFFIFVVVSSAGGALTAILLRPKNASNLSMGKHNDQNRDHNDH